MKSNALKSTPEIKRLIILGIRGIPAAHGGFETFAESFSLFLKDKGWDVTVFCQEKGNQPIYEDKWQGIRRIHISVGLDGAKGTVLFDLLSSFHASKKRISVLTLGYNTAIFCLLYRIKGIQNIINMDGIEWQRGKWTLAQRIWLFINEKFGAFLGNHLVADHPEIKNHLLKWVAPKKITVIPYSADRLKSADIAILKHFGLEADAYALVIARPEPENSMIEIVRAYSQKKRKIPLVILGDYHLNPGPYQKAVLNLANDNVLFLGAIYDKPIVQALRYFSRFYIHGHTVGGTNPSLVEALGAGSAVLAHDNKFNRWVAGKGAQYFSSESQCAEKIDMLIKDDQMILTLKSESTRQYLRHFTDEKIYGAYEQLIWKYGMK